jgi:hypothetical protein
MKPVVLLLAGLAAMVTGCVSVFAASYNYNLAVKNTGKEEVWCSLVASAKGIAHEPGVVIPGKSKTFAGPFKLPYADKWTVAWKTAKGEKFEKTLDLTDKFPKKFEGRLVFTIDADNNLGYVTETFSGK